MKLVVLDGNSINPGDLSWEALAVMGELSIWPSSSQEEALARAVGAEAVFVDSHSLPRAALEQMSALRFIGILATGYDNVDTEAAAELGIAVTNVPAYSTEAVSQHAIALLLELTNKVGIHNEEVQKGKWFDSHGITFCHMPLTVLAGKSMGIVGYGNIGKRVGEIAKALGMTVYVYSREPEAAVRADVISLHCPVTDKTAGLVNREFISRMKDGAFLINTARGGLLEEDAVAEALRSGKLTGAAVDVLAEEPPRREAKSPLLGLPNCLVTPHMAYMPRETRQRICDIAADNLKSFLAGGDRNRIV